MVVYPNVKINLGLSVLRRRPDGYHDIETLFIPYFGMTDVLEIVPSDKLRFATGCPTTTSTCPATRSASRCRRACA